MREPAPDSSVKVLSVRRSLAFSFLERYVGVLITLMSTVILSRLLTPEEIGIFSVSVAALGLAQTLRDFGVSNFLIQAPKVTDETIQTALTVSFAMSSVIGVLSILLAPVIAQYYQRTAIAEVVFTVSINFFLIPVSSTLMSLLRREMRFATIARINLGGGAAGALASILFAALGYAYMSLAYGSVVCTATTVIGAVALSGRCRWWRPSLRGWRAMLGFGGFATAAAFAGEANARAPDFILPKTLGFGAVGLYSKAYSAIFLVTSSLLEGVGAVFFPAIAQALRTGSGAPLLFRTSLQYVTAILLPVYFTLIVLADPFILLLFGPQWASAGLVASILGISASIFVLAFGIEYVLIASGRIARLLLFRIALVVPTFFVFYFFSLESLSVLAIATIPLAALSVGLGYLAVWDILEIGPREIIHLVSPAVLLGVISTAPVIALRTQWDGSELSAAMILFASGLLGGTVWLYGVWILKHPLWNEARDLIASIRLHFR